jgi:Ser/Thr protein kinase RdoA (MazF antagonist)
MSGGWTTHDTDMTVTRVVKRFQSCADGEHEREWRALSLLARYAPDLAPAPLCADLAAEPPVVVMSRLPGEPLRGGRVRPEQLEAMARTVGELFDAVPSPIAGQLPYRCWNQRQSEAAIRGRAAELPADVPDDIAAAVRAGMQWLNTSPLGLIAEADVTAVFGQADGNLANFLWDGDRVRVVDFEDSGRSDRAYELAEITEHVATWVDTDFDAALFLAHFTLTTAETGRLRDSRRLFALLWLLVLAVEDPDHPRNPPGTASRQAERMLALLS